jgi:hypothetical protein
MKTCPTGNLWSAPAERSGDGAFDQQAAQSPKRRGASLATGQNLNAAQLQLTQSASL